MPFVYIEKVLDLWVQLMKKWGKNKSVEFIILYLPKMYLRDVNVLFVPLDVHFVMYFGILWLNRDFQIWNI